MTDRQHLTIYGGTGFTASFVIRELLQGKLARWPPNFQWSIAGRNRAALESLRSSWFQEVDGSSHSVPLPEIIIADVCDQESLDAMAQQTQLILNCVGPFRDYGEPVVKACLKAATDYIDLCGEPEFIERMHLLYHDSAVAAGITICHAAAFDSVPCDLGVNLCKKLLAERGAYPSTVEMFLRLRTNSQLYVNFATYEAAVKGFSSTRELRKGRKELARIRPKPLPVGPLLGVKVGGASSSMLSRVGIIRNTRGGGWLIPFFFSDPAVVRLSQSLSLHMSKSLGAPPAEEAPVHFAAHIVIPNFRILLLFVVHFLIFQFLAIRTWGRHLLLKYPTVFSWGLVRKGGIGYRELEDTSFTQTFYARGYSPALHPTPANTPDVNLVVRISGPDPGYKATAVIFNEVASLMLRRRNNVKKGVLTPAAAFGHLDGTGTYGDGILDALQRNGKVTWKLLSSGATLM